MPLKTHFKPFPKPGEAYFEVTPPLPCPCEQDKIRCRKCRRQEREDAENTSPRTMPRSSSQAVLSPIKENSDPSDRPALTPKQIRDRRRASSRFSVASVFESAVGSQDYFTLFPNVRPRALTRYDSSSSRSSESPGRRRSARSFASGSGSVSSSQQSRSSSSDQMSPSIGSQTQTTALNAEAGVSEQTFDSNDLSRRDS